MDGVSRKKGCHFNLKLDKTTLSMDCAALCPPGVNFFTNSLVPNISREAFFSLPKDQFIPGKHGTGWRRGYFRAILASLVAVIPETKTYLWCDIYIDS